MGINILRRVFSYQRAKDRLPTLRPRFHLGKKYLMLFPFKILYFCKFLLAFCSRCFFFVLTDSGASLPSSCEAFLLLTYFTLAGMNIPVLMLMIMMIIEMMMMMSTTSSPCLHPWLTQRGSAGLFHIRWICRNVYLIMSCFMIR